MRYEDLNHYERERFRKRAASLNRLADAFGLVFQYDFGTEIAEAFIRTDRCVVPRNWNGEP